MSVFINAIDAKDNKMVLTGDSELLTHIPEHIRWVNEDETGKLLFCTPYEATKWIRKVVDYIPTDIRTFELFTTFIDKIKSNKGTFTRTGIMQIKSIYANEYRQNSFVEPLHTKLASRKIKRDDEDDELILGDPIDPLDDWDDEED